MIGIAVSTDSIILDHLWLWYTKVSNSFTHTNENFVADTSQHVYTFQAEAIKKSDSRWKVALAKCLKSLTHTTLTLCKKKSAVRRAGMKNNHMEGFFIIFSLKHNKDHNNIKLHKVQAYNIIIMVTVNTREHGGWYYNENRRKCINGSLSQTNGKWRKQR